MHYHSEPYIPPATRRPTRSCFIFVIVANSNVHRNTSLDRDLCISICNGLYVCRAGFRAGEGTRYWIQARIWVHVLGRCVSSHIIFSFFAWKLTDKYKVLLFWVSLYKGGRFGFLTDSPCFSLGSYGYRVVILYRAEYDTWKNDGHIILPSVRFVKWCGMKMLTLLCPSQVYPQRPYVCGAQH